MSKLLCLLATFSILSVYSSCIAAELPIEKRQILAARILRSKASFNSCPIHLDYSITIPPAIKAFRESLSNQPEELRLSPDTSLMSVDWFRNSNQQRILIELKGNIDGDEGDGNYREIGCEICTDLSGSAFERILYRKVTKSSKTKLFNFYTNTGEIKLKQSSFKDEKWLKYPQSDPLIYFYSVGDESIESVLNNKDLSIEEVGTEKFDGSTCTKFKISPISKALNTFSNIWIDTAHGFVIRKQEFWIKTNDAKKPLIKSSESITRNLFKINNLWLFEDFFKVNYDNVPGKIMIFKKTLKIGVGNDIITKVRFSRSSYFDTIKAQQENLFALKWPEKTVVTNLISSKSYVADKQGNLREVWKQ